MLVRHKGTLILCITDREICRLSVLIVLTKRNLKIMYVCEKLLAFLCGNVQLIIHTDLQYVTRFLPFIANFARIFSQFCIRAVIGNFDSFTGFTCIVRSKRLIRSAVGFLFDTGTVLLGKQAVYILLNSIKYVKALHKPHDLSHFDCHRLCRKHEMNALASALSHNVLSARSQSFRFKQGLTFINCNDQARHFE